MKGTTHPLADYLRARRARLQPAEVGLPDGGARRVSGLRREEVAALAGISSDYYLRIEQGRDRNPSDQVLSALARALRLSPVELRYLSRLARPEPHALRMNPHPVTDNVFSLLESWAHTPAYLFDRNLDVLASNRLMRAIAPAPAEPETNLLDTTMAGLADAMARGESSAVVEKWEDAVRKLVAALRYYSDADDPRLQEIVGELSLRYQVFRTVWALHEVQPLTVGENRVWVASTGWVEFKWQALELPTSPGQHIVTYLAEPGSRAEATIASFAQDYETRNRPDLRLA
jgi:transcriptional regulator with XRE-family HTH domain